MTTTSTNRFQDTHGQPNPTVVGKIRDHMHPWIQEFIEHAPFVVVASADGDGNCDASPKGGKPGFVKVLDDRHVLVPDVRGNNLFQSYGNIDSNPHVGLIFLIPGVNQTARVNGRAEVVDLEAVRSRGLTIDVFDPDENAALRQGMLVSVDEAYGQCPRSINFARLWDTDTIAANQVERPISPRPRGV
ncbi:MAG: pyridoxamine 5'-phosphate oxidase family protein [Acidimicrobiia bacterium]|nr:pyridoxamine 5'-phosphate oxidase family protein [Acidimicrobiia bacterium]